MTVNTTNPFDNGIFQIYPFSDRETSPDSNGKKYLVNGFDIRVQADMAYLEDERLYKAMLDGSNSIDVTVPMAPSYALDNGIIDTDKSFQRSPNAQMNSAANQIQSDRDLQVKHVALKFDTSLELTNEVYSPDSNDGTLFKLYFPFKVNAKVLGQVYPMWCCEINWSVTIKESVMRLSNPGTKMQSPDIAALKKGFGGKNGNWTVCMTKLNDTKNLLLQIHRHVH